MDTNKVLVIGGGSGCGKTTLCARVAVLARAQGLAVAGVITHPRYAHSHKVGLDVEDLRTGARRPLAERTACADGPSTGAWRFHAAGLAFGARALAQATPCDILVVDELGPLELVRGEGWRNGVDVLAAGHYGLALAVVRPALLAEFHRQLGAPTPVLSFDAADCEALAARILGELGDLP